MGKFSLGAASNVGGTFCAIALAIVAGFSAIHGMGELSTGAARSIVLDRDAIGNLQGLLSSVREAESEQRVYLLTGEPTYLAAYHRSMDEVKKQEVGLSDLAATGRLTGADVKRLARLVEERIKELEGTLRVAREGNSAAAVARIRTGRGRRTMTQLRAAADAQIAAENRRLSNDLAAIRRYTAARSYVFFAVGLLNMALLYWVFQRVRAEISSREALSAMLMTSSDAILSKDLEGNIHCWNQGAERLFGFKAEEAIGKSIALILPDDRVAEERAILSRLRAGKPYEELDTIRKTKDRGPIHVSLAVWPVRDRVGAVIG
ncbi:MAG: CHASE3 domain-containing protein, partial [Cyanobacteria bacterium REEB65]|nr:CHASE3 domain-containing protein [Cyanobacteria bacterium REEB65]